MRHLRATELTENLQARFAMNLQRCGALLDYVEDTQAIPDGLKDDMVRMVIVFLHASIEDLLRSILFSHFKHSPKKLYGSTKDWDHRSYNLANLWTDLNDANSQGGTLESFIDSRIQEVMNQVSFSRRGHFEKLLDAIQFPTRKFHSNLTELEALTQRRHSIVHSTDLDSDISIRQLANVDFSQAREWMASVTDFGTGMLAEFNSKPLSQAASKDSSDLSLDKDDVS